MRGARRIRRCGLLRSGTASSPLAYILLLTPAFTFNYPHHHTHHPRPLPPTPTTTFPIRRVIRISSLYSRRAMALRGGGGACRRFDMVYI